jgi:hypothetical protein
MKDIVWIDEAPNASLAALRMPFYVFRDSEFKNFWRNLKAKADRPRRNYIKRINKWHCNKWHYQNKGVL